MNNKEWLERLAHDAPDELAAWFDAEHVEPNDGIKPESVVRADSMDANDSREKLEDDVGFIVKEDFVTYKSIIGWLDRQAAITANETNYNNPYVGLVRGKQWERTEISDYYCGRCGWKVTDHDSYCPECGGALHKASNKPDSKFDARKTAETPETDAAKGDIRDFGDSREKLEAEVRKWCGMYPYQVDMVWVWLNRQAEITEREIEKKWSSFSDSVDGHIAEKQSGHDRTVTALERANAEIAKLQHQVDSLKRKLEAATDANTDYRDEWHRVCAERANLARDLGNAMAERDHYRELCGKLLDAADEMRRVRDAFDQFERGEA